MPMTKTDIAHWIFCVVQNMSIGGIAVFLVPPELVMLRAGLFSAAATRVTVLVIRSHTWSVVQYKEVDAFQAIFRLMLTASSSLFSNSLVLVPVLSVWWWYLWF